MKSRDRKKVLVRKQTAALAPAIELRHVQATATHYREVAKAYSREGARLIHQNDRLLGSVAELQDKVKRERLCVYLAVVVLFLVITVPFFIKAL